MTMPDPIVVPPGPADELARIAARAAMPYPLHTDLLGDTDKFIKNLAVAADTRLGSTAFWLGSSEVTTNVNGDITVNTGLSAVTGFVAGSYVVTGSGSSVVVPTMAVTGASGGAVFMRLWNPYNGSLQVSTRVGICSYAWGTR